MAIIYSFPRKDSNPMIELSNRSALYVAPKEPYKKWAKFYNQESEEELDLRLKENHVYLIDIITDADLKDILLPYYGKIFEFELQSWNYLEKEWPQNRSVDDFLDWFDVKLSYWVFDLENAEIEREED